VADQQTDQSLTRLRMPLVAGVAAAMTLGILGVLLWAGPEAAVEERAGGALTRTLDAGTASRDTIRIVGSSTVAPFASAAAEEFGRTTQFKTPIVEQTGTGGGMKLFCAGLGPQYPDITNASREIKASELAQCRGNGVTDVVEVKIGYDGIVLANAKDGPDFQLSLAELFLALGAYIPIQGELVENPYETWSDIRADLPDREIEVLGPPPTSGTRDAFNELGLDPGARQLERPVTIRRGFNRPCAPNCDDLPEQDLQWIRPDQDAGDFYGVRTERYDSMDALHDARPEIFVRIAQFIREDGHFTEAGESDNLIVQKLLSNPNAVGIFGYSFLDQNSDRVKPAEISQGGGEFVEPTFETIESDAYPISRSLFFYLKKQHLESVPGIRDYLAEFLSEDAAGYYGYLAERGLIPLSPADKADVLNTVEVMRTIDMTP